MKRLPKVRQVSTVIRTSSRFLSSYKASSVSEYLSDTSQEVSPTLLPVRHMPSNTIIMARESKLDNNLRDWEWYDNPKMVCVYGFLLSCANSKPCQWHGIVLERGQAVITMPKIAAGAKVSKKSARTCLARLIDSGEIIRQSTNKYSIITIVNYEKYHKTEETPADAPKEEEVSKDRRSPSEPLAAPASNADASDEELYKSQMLTDQSWQEMMCMNFKMDKADMLAKLNAFFLDAACRAHIHKDVNDAKRHFNNWLRIIISNAKKQKDNGNNNQQNYNRRRGFEITATSAEDYESSF